MNALELGTWQVEFGDKICSDKVQEYLDFIVQAVESCGPDEYSEWHHVIPRCLDKEHKYDSQGVRVRGRDHFTAHLKLVDCFSRSEERYRLSCAVSFMSGHRKVELTPQEFEEMRRVRSECSKGPCNPAKSPEVRRKMSENHADFSGSNHPMYGVSRYGKDNPMYGKSHTASTRKRISETRKLKGLSKGKNNPMYGVRLIGELNPMYGKSHSIRSKEIMSEKKSGSNNPCYGKICINDGSINKYIPRDSEIPVGWSKGKIIKKRKKEEM